jgi:hypothetical protein
LRPNRDGSAPRSGRGGRRFKSCHSDQHLAPSETSIPTVSPTDTCRSGYCRRQLLANVAIAASARRCAALLRLAAGLCQSRISKDRKERSASAIRGRICSALAIVDDEPLDGHGLHCGHGDANSGMADAGCGAEQNHSLLGSKRRRRLCHSYSRRQLLANAAMAASRVAS